MSSFFLVKNTPVSFLVKNTSFPTIVFVNPDRYMEITDSACVPTFSFPFVLDCHQYYQLMVAQGEGRSPMTSSDAETDSKPIIIINIIMPKWTRTFKSESARLAAPSVAYRKEFGSPTVYD